MMKTEDAGEAIAAIVTAMAAYTPEYIHAMGVTRCQHCQAQQSVLDKPQPRKEHTSDCAVMKARAIMLALSRQA